MRAFVGVERKRSGRDECQRGAWMISTLKTKPEGDRLA